MDIQGTYTLQAAPEEVWQCLMDRQALRHNVPGLERLETVGETAGGQTYAFTLHIRHAPLRGTYTGQAVVDELRYPTSYRMTLEGEGQQSNFQGIWEIHLSTHNNNTVIAYTGTLHAGKVGAFLPTPLVKGTIKVLIQQFFTSLAEQLRATGRDKSSPYEYDTTAEEQDEASLSPALSNGRTSVESSSRPTRLHMLVHQLGLGDNDPLLEDQWVTRLKRFGTFSALLLLVWIGMRLPRRLFSQH